MFVGAVDGHRTQATDHHHDVQTVCPWLVDHQCGDPLEHSELVDGTDGAGAVPNGQPGGQRDGDERSCRHQ